MMNLAQLIDGSADEMTKSELRRLYQIADADGDALAMKLIVCELEKKNDKIKS